MSALPQTTQGLSRTHSRSRSGQLSPSAYQGSWASMKKPHFKRSGSHRVDPFLSIRRILVDMMPPDWKTEQELHVLSKNICAVSAGMFTAHVIENCPLDRWGTEMLAGELGVLPSIKDLTFIIDPKTNRLIIANVKILVQRISDYPESEEITFLTFGIDQFERIRGQDIPFLVNTLSLLSHSLSNAFSHVIQLNDGHDGCLKTESQMRTFCDWLAFIPVVYVASADVGRHSEKGIDWEELKLKERRLIKIMLEGSHAGNDHVMDVVIPKSLFHLDSLAEPGKTSSRSRTTDTSPFETPLSLSCPSHFTFRELQDNLQTIMFDRLNSSEAASRLWSDVSVMIED